MKLSQKIDISLEIIRAFTEQAKNPYLSCSWGKDSLALLWLVLKVNPSIPVIWFDGGKFDELPETKALAQKVSESWHVNLTVVYPEKSLVEQWKAYGIPDARFTKQENEYTKQFVAAFQRETIRCGYDGHYLGMRAQESKYRRFVFSKRGHTYFVKGESLWRCNPLWDWQTDEIWRLIDGERLPYHPVYDQTMFQPREKLRLGVLAETCFGRKGALMHMKYYYPDEFNELCAMFPTMRTYV